MSSKELLHFRSPFTFIVIFNTEFHKEFKTGITFILRIERPNLTDWVATFLMIMPFIILYVKK